MTDDLNPFALFTGTPSSPLWLAPDEDDEDDLDDDDDEDWDDDDDLEDDEDDEA